MDRSIKNLISEKEFNELHEKIVEFAGKRTNPFDIQGYEFSGDVFYSDINLLVCGRFKTHTSKNNAAYSYACDLLKSMGYYIHS